MFDDFWPFQHLEMAVPVTELIPQQLGYFERGSAHTLELRSIYPLTDNRRRAVEKETGKEACRIQNAQEKEAMVVA